MRVTTTSGCGWSASSAASFVNLIGSVSSGTGTARFGVSANNGAARQGTVRIAWTGGGQDVSVSQVAAPPPPGPTTPTIENRVDVPTQTEVSNQTSIPTSPPQTRPNAGACTSCPILGTPAVGAGGSPSIVLVQLTSANGVPFNTVILTTGDLRRRHARRGLVLHDRVVGVHHVGIADTDRSAGQAFTAQFAVAANSELPVNYVPASLRRRRQPVVYGDRAVVTARKRRRFVRRHRDDHYRMPVVRIVAVARVHLSDQCVGHRIRDGAVPRSPPTRRSRRERAPSEWPVRTSA